MFSCEFSEISKNTFFTEHLRTTASAFSFSEAGTGGVLWKKNCSRRFCKIHRKTNNWFSKFSRTPFLQNTSGQLLPAIPCNFTKMRHWQQCSENLRYSLSKNINLRSTVQVYHFFLGSINFQCMFSLVYTVYCQKQPSE